MIVYASTLSQQVTLEGIGLVKKEIFVLSEEKHKHKTRYQLI